MKRRDFFKVAGAGAAGLVLSQPLQANFSANEKINMALIGCGWQGDFHLQQLLPRNDVNLVAVCDCFQPRLEEFKRRAGDKCDAYKDFRHVLDRKDIDAVIIATPDHWHGLMTIMACQAGKDVFVEKPMTTTVAEGRKVVEAARRHGRVVQVGIQQRTMPVFKHAVNLAHTGRLGRIVRTRAWAGHNAAIPVENHQNPPAGLDWDLWLGPAPWVPYSPQRHYAFRAFRDYAGGELTNWGVHLIDIAMWAMEEEAPRTIQSVAAPTSLLPGEDPIGMEVLYEFKSGVMTWTQATPRFEFEGQTLGTLFEGSMGRAVVTRASCNVKPASLGIPEFHSTGFYSISLGPHHDDFINCIKTRNRPAADCEIGHRSTTACNLGNIAMEMRRKLVWDGAKEQFVNDEAANRKLHRPARAPWLI
ncbi:MAG: Gfo/Idh/MocA family oxidoreductase [Candidatus Sumerlaeia bacterium]|nr:Gfo/Idh/MocA family oxidoreductase [Candidatus Sumerlaeia bacterium]